jgi:XTP/dITP diphosphohydrolase
MREKSVREFTRLLDIMDELRVKCPWDMKQTNQTLRKLTIEETYELADAILQDDNDSIRKELGDLLLHVAFYSKIGSEKGLFDIGDVLEGINNKLVYRHPHVFGDVSVTRGAREVEENWEKLKMTEHSGINRFCRGPFIPSGYRQGQQDTGKGQGCGIRLGLT